MANGIYVSADSARARLEQLETASHNLANMITSGYRRRQTIFAEVQADVLRQSSPQQALGVHRPVRFLPEDLRWTPVKCKRPCHGDDWQNHPYSLGELLQLPFNYTGFGLMTGPVSNAMVLDLDGPGHERTFLHHMKRELAALPPTVSWSSGRPHRHSRR